MPNNPSALDEYSCGVIREDQADVSLWSLTNENGEKVSMRIKPTFTSNDGEVIRGWAVEGLGIVERSEWSISADLQAGRLIQILPDWSLSTADIVALVNPHIIRAARVEAFLEYLVNQLSSPPWISSMN